MLTNEDRDAEIYQELVLHTFTDKFIIEPLESPEEFLVIDRLSLNIALEQNHGQLATGEAIKKPICGIFGIIHLLGEPLGRYLIVITRKSRVGEICGNVIWKVEDTELIPFAKTQLHLTEEQVQNNKTYLAMMQLVLQTQNFYFSTSYDLSHTLQRLHNTSPDFRKMPLFERADDRFLWNSYLMRDFLEIRELSRYWLPIIFGFISIKQFNIEGKHFTWTVVSRRGCQRAGTRMFMRGIDSDGFVANYVETEQIVECQVGKCSFVQTRGSIPLFWTQLPDLRYKPPPTISPALNHELAFRNHFDSQIFNYGKQTIINLIDHKGAEDKLEKALAHIISTTQNANIRYVSFDFHHECKHMRWDRLSILMDKVSAEQEAYGYFMITSDGNLKSIQDGVFRTNCVDCLDRTNVVQSMLAKRCLTSQLRTFGIFRNGQSVEHFSDLEYAYKNVWADNADVCSIQYAGTGALKNDFTRTGKRTRWGLLKDGINSLIRYYKNNFADGFRQDAIDLFLGNYQVEENEGVTKPCPLTVKRGGKLLILPLFLLFALAMCFISYFIFSEHTLGTLLVILFWIAMIVASLLAIFYNGSEFVDYPKLKNVRPEKKYD